MRVAALVPPSQGFRECSTNRLPPATVTVPASADHAVERTWAYAPVAVGCPSGVAPYLALKVSLRTWLLRCRSVLGS